MRKRKSIIQEPDNGTLKLFKFIDLFAGLDEESIKRMSRIANVQSFQDGETILLAGDVRRALFFIVKGQAKILSDGKNYRETILNLVGAGDFFGEIPLFRKEGRVPLSVRAEGDCTILIFRGKDFLSELSVNPKLSQNFMALITGYLSKAYTKITALSVNTIRGRILYCLMQFVEEMGVRVKDEKGNFITVLRNRPSQAQIADMSGTTRETVNRELSSLIKDGSIEINGKELIIRRELKI